jgi:predicted transporter
MAKEVITLRVSIWVLFVFLLFTPMIAEFVFVSDILPVAQRIFPFWKSKPIPVFLSDILFFEAGVFIVFGALIAGTILYNSWANLDVRKVQFTEYIWNWRKIKEERNSPTGLTLGLTLLAIGIIYVLVAIFVPTGIMPAL